MITRENVRTEVSPSDGVVSRELDRSPPSGVDQHFVVEPIRDELLAGFALAELSELGGQLGLTASNPNCALKRRNVVFLHEHRKYTRNLVNANNNSCFPTDKEVCTVLAMAQAKVKPIAKPAKKPGKRRKQELEVGPDGLTLPQRVTRLMIEHGVGQTELARLCSQHYAAFVPSPEDKVKQQHIFNLLQGQATAWCLPLVAAVFDVSDMWLQFGIGKRERHPKH